MHRLVQLGYLRSKANEFQFHLCWHHNILWHISTPLQHAQLVYNIQSLEEVFSLGKVLSSKTCHLKEWHKSWIFSLSARPGLEPGYRHSECRVLPLDALAKFEKQYILK